MKERKIKQFFKRNLGWIAFGIWVILLDVTAILLFFNIPLKIKLSLVAICIIYTALGLLIIYRWNDKNEKKRADESIRDLKD